MEKIKFNGYEFLINPETILIKHSRNYAQFSSVLSGSIVQNLGTNATVFQAEGCFYGNDCYMQYQNLLAKLNGTGEGILYVPNIIPFKAILCNLEVTANSAPNLLCYKIKFISKEFR
ncbi:MAG: DNA circularization N-terminal domain-containing protein [Oscillospiraceae bacterium]